MMKEFLVALFLAVFTVLFVDGVRLNDDVMKAIEAGDKEKLLGFLANGTDINECLNKEYPTLLTLAIERKKEDLALLLIEMGADPSPSCRGSDYSSPLLAATKTGSKTLVNVLLAKGAKIDVEAIMGDIVDNQTEILELFLAKGIEQSDDHDRTWLFFAVAYGRANLTEFLLEKGANMEHKNDEGYTALNYACSNLGYNDVSEYDVLEKCMAMLIDGGANVNTTDIYDNSTPLIYASKSGSFNIVKKLIEKGADVNAMDNRGKTALSFVMDNLKKIPLEIASKTKLKDIPKLLLENGADVRVGSWLREIVKGDYGYNDELIWAIKMGQKDTLLDLISNGTDINRCLESFNCKPLSLAIAEKNEEIIRILIENGAEVNGVCYLRDSCSPLEVATREGLMTVVKTVLDKGAVIDVIALMTTYDYDRKDIRHLFLERGFDPNKTFGYCNRTMLFDAAAKGYVNMTKLLLEKEVDIEHRDCYGYTALNWACHEMMVNQTLTKKIEKCVEVLIDGGANVNATNEQDNSYSLYYATKSNSSLVVKKLMEKGAIFGNHTEYGPNGRG